VEQELPRQGHQRQLTVILEILIANFAVLLEEKTLAQCYVEIVLQILNEAHSYFSSDYKNLNVLTLISCLFAWLVQEYETRVLI
jgi:Na+/H+-translocating membrane pyrophosphatase